MFCCCNLHFRSTVRCSYNHTCSVGAPPPPLPCSVGPPLLIVCTAAGLAQLPLSSSPVGGALLREARTVVCSFVCNKVGACSWRAETPEPPDTDSLSWLFSVFHSFLSLHCAAGSLIPTGTDAVKSSDGARTLCGGARCFFEFKRQA